MKKYSYSYILEQFLSIATGIELDVLEWLSAWESGGYATPLAKLNDLFYGGCVSGIVCHLIYYTDTTAYYDEHRQHIELIFQLKDVKPEDVELHKNEYAWKAFEKQAQAVDHNIRVARGRAAYNQPVLNTDESYHYEMNPKHLDQQETK